jgi:excisionase family DNA binding protein
VAQIQESSIFNSWKEIAAYLKCDVRTCRRWEEELGLPVHRMGTGSKFRVFAYKAELDEWMRARPGNGRTSHRGFLSSIRPVWILIPAGTALVAIVAYLLYSSFLKIRQPADFQIKGSVLHILDEKGKDLFRYDTHLDNLTEESEYKTHFQYKRKGRERWEGILPYLAIKDINGDDELEILFSTQTQDEFNEGELICFSSKGKENWRIKTGRQLTYGDRVFSADYRIYGFNAFDLDGDGKLEILILSVHRPDFPSQLLAVSPEGKILGEYWNSGHMSDLLLSDVDGDGRKELIVSGTNNEYRSGCLIVFDAADIEGVSPQSQAEYAAEGLGPGSEKFYIRFPRTDLEINEAKQDSIISINLLADGRLSAVTFYTGLIYEFSADLSKHEVSPSHQFEQLYAKGKREGFVQGELNKEYYDRLDEGVLYWTGKEWAATPAKVQQAAGKSQ